MRGKQLLKNIRLVILTILGLFFGVVIGGVYYLNETGGNKQWRDNIAHEIENLGVIVDFESLRYRPSRGLIAKGVNIYADETRKEVIARLEHLVIDVDKTKLARGKLRVNEISLSDASISLPLDPEEPEGPRIIITDLKGDMYLPDKNTIEAKGVSGVVAGIQLKLDAHIWSRNLGKAQEQTDDEKHSRVTRIKIIAKMIQEISRWDWPENKPPQLKIYAEGNLDSPDSAHIEFSLMAEELERDDIILHNIEIRGDYNNKVVTLDRIALEDGSGKFEALADFHPNSRKGKFKITNCSLHLQMLARKLLGLKVLSQVIFSTPPEIACMGGVVFDSDLKPSVELSGQVEVRHFSILGTQFEHLKSELSVQGTNAFLTNLHVRHVDGEVKGRALIKDGILRYEVDSTLPAKALIPFVLSPIAKRELGRASFSPSSRLHIQSQGVINNNRPGEWSVNGQCQISNFSYKKVPLTLATASYSINPKKTQFTQIKLTFDYEKYKLHRKFGGPRTGRVNADKVTIDHIDKMVHISNVRTTSWPSPTIRLFHTASADHCEQYQFLRPPNLSADGSFDLNRNQARTDFKIAVRAPGTTHYKFLGETLKVRQLRGNVRIRQGLVDVTNLAFNTFQGRWGGKISVLTKEHSYKGSFHGSRFRLKDVGDTYHFDDAKRGLITGRIEFNGKNSDLSQFQGKGAIALEQGNLFSIPMLGPLSPLIGVVLKEKNPTNEHAENASCTFVIRNGIVYSDNFIANTKSLRFTGEGNVDLPKKEINLMVRMNAQGVFSILTLPLKPFMGLFQFSGTGKLSAPKWTTSIFTTPKRGKNDPIFRHPPKARVIPE